MSPTRFGSRPTTTTIRSHVRSSSCICVSGGLKMPPVNGLCVWCLEHSACCRKCCRCRGPWYCCSDARSAGAPNSCMPASSFRGHAGGGSWNMQWECRGGGEYLRNDKKVKWCSDFTFGRVWCGGLCGLQTLLFAVRVATASDAIISASISVFISRPRPIRATPKPMHGAKTNGWHCWSDSQTACNKKRD